MLADRTWPSLGTGSSWNCRNAKPLAHATRARCALCAAGGAARAAFDQRKRRYRKQFRWRGPKRLARAPNSRLSVAAADRRQVGCGGKIIAVYACSAIARLRNILPNGGHSKRRTVPQTRSELVPIRTGNGAPLAGGPGGLGPSRFTPRVLARSRPQRRFP